MSQYQQTRNESLSALLDGECTELELRRLLKDWGEDPALREQYRCLAASRSAMNPESAAWAGCDITARVREATEASPFKPGLWQRTWQPLASMAVAASVAVAVVAGVAYWPVAGQPTDAGPSVVAALPVLGPNGGARIVSTAPLEQPVATVSRPAALANEADLDRFESYVQRHAEYASFNSNSGLMPFARVAGFQRAE